MEALGLTQGELFVVVFVFLVVVSAPWFPRLGAWVADRLMGAEDPPPPRNEEDP